MTNIETTGPDTAKLVNNIPSISLDDLPPRCGSTKRRIRRVADPHIRPHKVKGRVYYTYCRGTDPEIYLGSADTILRAVKGNQNSIRRK